MKLWSLLPKFNNCNKTKFSTAHNLVLEFINVIIDFIWLVVKCDVCSLLNIILPLIVLFESLKMLIAL